MEFASRSSVENRLVSPLGNAWSNNDNNHLLAGQSTVFRQLTFCRKLKLENSELTSFS